LSFKSFYGYTGIKSEVEHFMIKQTKSLCPECLKVLEASIYEEDGKILIAKVCSEHGEFKDVYYGDAGLYHKFMNYFRDGSGITNPHTQSAGNCPSDCGLCDNHKSSTVLANLDLTNACNFRCPVCFANADASGYVYHPSLEQISGMMDTLRNEQPPCSVIQFSGGEPTLRKEFFEIVKMAKQKGFKQIQVATNGKKLAEDPGYARRMGDAGVDTVYLQFDGLTPDIYLKLRGLDALPLKMQAIENVRKSLPYPNIVLVPTLARGINDHQIGDMVRFAAENIDVIRGINFQPVSFTGRISNSDLLVQRLTIADMLMMLGDQTDGTVAPEDFLPVPAFTPLLEFLRLSRNAVNLPRMNTHPVCGAWSYLIRDGKRLVPLTRIINLAELFALIDSPVRMNKAEIGLKITARLPKLIKPGSVLFFNDVLKLLKDIVFQGTHKAAARFHGDRVLFIGSMHFMDPYNFDCERLQHCCIHYAIADGRVIPFCSYNTLYRNEVEAKFARKNRQITK
jgi:uncharacterized radical SAM superfamily Fe-S cluster-containing enzyme